MSLPITPNTFQEYCVRHPANAPSLDIVASLVGTPMYPELLAAVLQHLRHERQVS
jgi:dTDP-4-dehydrorhamnose reductase